MPSRRTPRLLAAAAVAGSVLLVAPAFAAGPYTVTAGSTSTGTTDFSGTAGTVTFKSPNATVTCTSSTAGGSVNLGDSADGVGIASIDESTFTSCSGPFGTKFAITQSNPWRLNATGPAGTSTAGTIDQVAATAVTTAGISCSFSVAGSVDAAFDSGAQSLNLTTPTSGATLTISNVSGCFGLVSNGQTATMTASYAVTTTAGALTIS